MTHTTRPATTKKGSQQKRLPAARLDELIEEATVDAHDESEQTAGFFTMFEEHLALPFKTEVPGVDVTVDRIDMTDDEQIVAVCTRGKARQRILITELPLPEPQPEGWEWIDAYRRWGGGR